MQNVHGGVKDIAELSDRVFEIFKIAGLEEDIYKLGLNGTITSSERHAELVERVLKAREALPDRLSDPKMKDLVEFFDRDHYNTTMSVMSPRCGSVAGSTVVTHRRSARFTTSCSPRTRPR